MTLSEGIFELRQKSSVHYNWLISHPFLHVDEDDGVPNFPGVSDGYQSSTRNSFWQRDPVGANNTFICTSTSDFQTQKQCGEGRNGSGINQAHLTYFGHPLNVNGPCPP